MYSHIAISKEVAKKVKKQAFKEETTIKDFVERVLMEKLNQIKESEKKYVRKN